MLENEGVFEYNLFSESYSAEASSLLVRKCTFLKINYERRERVYLRMLALSFYIENALAFWYAVAFGYKAVVTMPFFIEIPTICRFIFPREFCTVA